MKILFLALLLSACSINPHTPSKQNELAETYTRLSLAYLAQNRNDLAVERAGRALKLKPDSARINYVYALALQRNFKYPAANEYFAKALKLRGGKYPEAKNAYAVNLCLQGQPVKGRALLTELLTDPTYTTPQLARENLKKCHG